MNIRTRSFLALLAVALLPLALVAVGVRWQLGRELATERAGAIERWGDDAARRLDARTLDIGARLDAIAASIAGDTRVRTWVLSGNDEIPPWLADLGETTMRQAALDGLLLLDAGGRVLSAGHFRNSYGTRLAVSLDSAAALLLTLRTPRDPLELLAAERRFTVAGSRFVLLGGLRLGEVLATLAADPSLTVSAPDSVPADGVIERIELPAIDATADPPVVAQRAIVVITDAAAAEPLVAALDRWLLLALVAAAVLAALLAAFLAGRIARPISALADRAEAVDYERLDATFDTGAPDELGRLGRVLDGMLRRLREGSERRRAAERAAATGDLARQVNHDIRNGLAPIRNTLRHLAQVAEQEPARLAEVYGERKGALESGLQYLEGLSRSYARLSPALDAGATDAAAVLEEVVRDLDDPRVAIKRAGDGALPVRADRVALRRIVENLSRNALESLERPGSAVTLFGDRLILDGVPVVRLIIADTGRGMTGAALERAFEQYETTRPDGTGLGLAVVRRLVEELGGALRVTSRPGEGTTFQVDLPVRDPEQRS